MSWAAELGVVAIPPAAGQVLRLLATATKARAAVEIGTGTGVSSLWLLRGLAPDGVLTSIDIEPDHQAMARQSFAAAGFAPGRARLIAGAAGEVLPRLADAAYDLVFIDGDIGEYAQAVSAAHRLLRPGGVMIVNNALADRVDERERLIISELTAYLRDTPDWSTTVLAVGAGLLCATKPWSEGR
jgi:predicted O-methyltransferase YrrM